MPFQAHFGPDEPDIGINEYFAKKKQERSIKCKCGATLGVVQPKVVNLNNLIWSDDKLELVIQCCNKKCQRKIFLLVDVISLGRTRHNPRTRRCT